MWNTGYIAQRIFLPAIKFILMSGVLRNVSVLKPNSSFAIIAANFTASYIFKGMSRFHSTSSLFCRFSCPKTHDPHRYWSGSSKVSFQRSTLPDFSIISKKKTTSSRWKPFCIVLEFILLSYLGHGALQHSSRFNKILYGTREIWRRTIKANLIFELDKMEYSGPGLYSCPLVSTYTVGSVQPLIPQVFLRVLLPYTGWFRRNLRDFGKW